MPSDLEVDRRRTEVLDWYADARHRFLRVEDRFGERIRRVLRERYLSDVKLESRTKTPGSLAEKAATVLDGAFKYDDPRTQITDLVGFRLLVPLVTDLPPVQRMLDGLFTVEEASDRRANDEPDVPGYQSLHLLVRLRPEDRDDVDLSDLGDPVVEIQVRTILQHAWAALQHDLLYKSEREPSDAVRRRLVALAGLLELAEREFVQVRQVHGVDSVSDARSDAGVELDAGWRVETMRRVFGDDEPADADWDRAWGVVLDELGVTSAEELTSALAVDAARAREALRALRTRERWATREYAADLMVRRTLGPAYLQRRSPGAERSPETMAAFLADNEAYAALLDGGPA